MYYSLLAGVSGIIVNYLVISYGIPLAFPSVYKYQQIKNKLNVTKVAVPLTTGSCSFDTSSVELNTSNPNKDGFVFMPSSNNIKGGSQFTYSFWLDIKSSYKTHLNDTNIFMRGNKSTKKGLYDSNVANKYPMIVCPLIKFPNNIVPVINNGDSSTDTHKSELLEIIFNTTNNPHTSFVIDEDVYKFISSSNSNPRWFLITITFQDYIDFSNSEKGIQVQNFINDNLVSTKVFKNDSLKTNIGNVYLTPSFTEDDSGSSYNSSSYYADLTYFNYALDIIEIENLYKRGVSNADGQCITAKYSTKKSTSPDYYHTLGMNNYV